jgi:predicted esterase
MLSAVTIAPQSGHHRSTCIFLHGLGDSGHGWAEVARLLAKKLPFTKFILPHA